MKGIVLAGGEATRLRPATSVVNKHLLNIFDRPMLFYPIQTLKDAGIKDVMIITGGSNPDGFLRLLKNGEEFGMNITYKYQTGSGGIPTALALAKDFVGGDDKFVAILGDNILQIGMKEYVRKFERSRFPAMVLLKPVSDPERYGIAEVRGELVMRAVEKPKEPKSNLAITGIYFFDREAFDWITKLKPSQRRETEVVDLLNMYAKRKQLTYDIIKGFWIDAGTKEALFKANMFAYTQQ